MACILPNQGCIEYEVQSRKEGKIDESSVYWYCDLCDGIKHYVTLEQARGRRGTHWMHRMLGNAASGQEFERPSKNLGSIR